MTRVAGSNDNATKYVNTQRHNATIAYILKQSDNPTLKASSLHEITSNLLDLASRYKPYKPTTPPKPAVRRCLNFFVDELCLVFP